MRQSELLFNTLRDVPSDAEIVSHRLMLKAGYVRQVAAGVYSYLPLGRRVLHRIERIVREEMDRAGAQEVLLPAMQPAELWKESGRYADYGPELIRLRDRHDREFALGPTHEEVITALVKSEIHSYRRLPVTLYQIQTKFRDERRPRFGLMRGREFVMKDAYSFHTSWEDLDRVYRGMYAAYHRIFERCGLPVKAVEADPGTIGGEGGTHEFMVPAEVGEDTVIFCSQCDYAANVEVLQAEGGAAEEGTSCAVCGQGELRMLKGIEVGHIFKLGRKYSESLGARYINVDGKEEAMIMGCYGIGVSRLLSAIIERNHDERGIVWPAAVAPYAVHLVQIAAKDVEQTALAEELYAALRERDVAVLYDDRDERVGVKLADADLLGIPIRFIIGKHASERMIEVVHRRSGETEIVRFEEAVAMMNKCC